MNTEIKTFIETFDSVKCGHSFEFRLRITKLWLKYQESYCATIEKELLDLIASYKKRENK